MIVYIVEELDNWIELYLETYVEIVVILWSIILIFIFILISISNAAIDSISAANNITTQPLGNNQQIQPNKLYILLYGYPTIIHNLITYVQCNHQYTLIKLHVLLIFMDISYCYSCCCVMGVMLVILFLDCVVLVYTDTVLVIVE